MSDSVQESQKRHLSKIRPHGLASVTRWIGDRIGDLIDGRIPNPKKTFAYWWIRNSGDGEYFTRKDAIAEVVHDLMAFNQWGSTIYKIVLKLAVETGDLDIRSWFKKTMEG